MSEKVSIYNLSRKTLENFLVENGEKKFRATQIFEAIYRNGYTNFDDITTLSKDGKSFFNNNFEKGILIAYKTAANIANIIANIFLFISSPFNYLFCFLIMITNIQFFHYKHLYLLLFYNV